MALTPHVLRGLVICGLLAWLRTAYGYVQTNLPSPPLRNNHSFAHTSPSQLAPVPLVRGAPWNSPSESGGQDVVSGTSPTEFLDSLLDEYDGRIRPYFKAAINGAFTASPNAPDVDKFYKDYFNANVMRLSEPTARGIRQGVS
ncbi:Glycine receptor subunit alpha-3 [Branchiostoma belcheri]|nr:Glycine receptor subunit alpha-3 [Branchiostoma belcheri]